MKQTALTTSVAGGVRLNMYQRAMQIKEGLGIQQAITLPMFSVPQRHHAERADWWMYPAELDYALWVNGEIPVRAVHWPTILEIAPHFDRLFMAHEMPRGAEFTERLALAPSGFVRVGVKAATLRGIKFGPYAPPEALARSMYYEQPKPRQMEYDPILFGVVTDGRTGVFMPIASWTWAANGGQAR